MTGAGFLYMEAEFILLDVRYEIKDQYKMITATRSSLNIAFVRNP